MGKKVVHFTVSMWNRFQHLKLLVNNLNKVAVQDPDIALHVCAFDGNDASFQDFNRLLASAKFRTILTYRTDEFGNGRGHNVATGGVPLDALVCHVAVDVVLPPDIAARVRRNVQPGFSCYIPQMYQECADGTLAGKPVGGGAGSALLAFYKTDWLTIGGFWPDNSQWCGKIGEGGAEDIHIIRKAENLGYDVVRPAEPDLYCRFHPRSVENPFYGIFKEKPVGRKSPWVVLTDQRGSKEYEGTVHLCTTVYNRREHLEQLVAGVSAAYKYRQGKELHLHVCAFPGDDATIEELSQIVGRCSCRSDLTVCYETFGYGRGLNIAAAAVAPDEVLAFLAVDTRLSLKAVARMRKVRFGESAWIPYMPQENGNGKQPNRYSRNVLCCDKRDFLRAGGSLPSHEVWSVSAKKSHPEARWLASQLAELAVRVDTDSAPGLYASFHARDPESQYYQELQKAELDKLPYHIRQSIEAARPYNDAEEACESSESAPTGQGSPP